MNPTVTSSLRQRRRRSARTVGRKRISTFRFGLVPISPVIVSALLLLLVSTLGANGRRAPFSTRISTIKLDFYKAQRESVSLTFRGGATVAAPEDEEQVEDDKEETGADIRQHPDYAKLQSYRMRQQVLLQLRAIHLSEALAKRGVPLPCLQDVSTPEGKAKPKNVDWECIQITKENALECMYTYEDQVGTKLIAPVDPKNVTDVPKNSEWITIVALNRQRRKDISKVDAMWHNKYAILDSWFKVDSEYSLLQHVGWKGILLNTLLNETILSLVVGLSLYLLLVLFLPVWEALLSRFLVSGMLWSRWHSWGRFVHLGLPFKLMVGQWILENANKGFQSIKGKIKEQLVEMECKILVESVPLTLGVPTPARVEEGDAAILQEEEEIMEHLIQKESLESDDDEGDDSSEEDLDED
ncbi:hypothetical protein IV203_015272 [Nitzschia inconspicua]|uniref:Uncharacterized protein n=1 Tax=Nitzschia inconspicua TaxID=303405 RepID=A0A9K3K7H0_9STRA|nr:hypothetical protein IV203_020227 [Nitzschia inconspicua]KAG7358683.1 hypothetical protein IV203_015272 [Nitzschia inconspicua]